jgi:hypothetical protein
MSTVAEIRTEALERARTGSSESQYADILAGFMEKGIAPEAIIPRENVLTFNAWKALARHVKRGEHGVRILTWIPCKERAEEGAEVREGDAPRAGKRSLRPKGAVLFHFSQTEPD